MYILHINNPYLLLQKYLFKIKYSIMNNMLNFFKDFYYTFSDNSKQNIDPDLIRYFKSEFGSQWKPELEKYLIKNSS